MTDERRDALEAVAAALLFGEDMGLACEDARRDGGEDGAAYPGAGNIVDLSAGARDLVAEAMEIARGIQPEICGPGVRSWDVHGAVKRAQGGA